MNKSSQVEHTRLAFMLERLAFIKWFPPDDTACKYGTTTYIVLHVWLTLYHNVEFFKGQNPSSTLKR